MRRSLVTIIAFILFSLAGTASPKNDPAVRRGVLPNGLTYYIRNNGYPEGFADFHLVVKAGFVDQEDEKSGVAHFLEHVCFNGSEHFPGNSMIEWLRGKGVAYGENFNAVTNEENTIFNISNVPVREREVVDSCILMLHDLAHSVEISEVSVEKERPVILEERRFIDSPASRVADASRRYIYGDTKHGRYNAVGSEEALRNVTAEALRKFYRECYRPDLQAVVIVGDVNVNAIEKALKETFADVPAASGEVPEREQSAVYSDSPVVGLIPDAELVTSGLNILWRFQPRGSADVYRESVLRFMLGRLIDSRLSDEASALGSPLIEVRMAMSRYSADLDAFEVSSYVLPGHELKAFESIMTVIEKVRRFGFDDAEIERLGREVLAYFADMASSAYSLSNSQIAAVLSNNFLYGMHYMDPAAEYAEVAGILKSMDASVLGEYADEVFSNIEPVVICSYPSRADRAVLSEAEFLDVLNGIRNSGMEVAEAGSVDSGLPDLADLEGSKVEDTVKYSDGTYVWYLENGMRVVFMPASKDSDVIGVELFWNGGLSQVPTGELAVFEENLWGMYLRNSGVAGLSRKALDSAISGSFISVEPYMNQYTHGMTGQASSRDAETLLKLMYLYCVSPRFDAAEYEDMLSMVKGTLPTLEALPSHRIEALSDSLSYGNNPRVLRLNEKLLSKARIQHLEDNYRRLFSNAAGSTALVISDCKPKEVLALVQKYLGSIPTVGIAPETVFSNVPEFVSGRIFREFTVEQEMPVAEVAQMFHAPMEYDSFNYVAMQAVGYILSMRCVDVLRDKEGGTYSPMVQAGLSAIYDGQATIQIIFQCAPSEVDRMRSLAAGVVENLAVEGPSEEEVGNAVRYIVKGIDEKSSSISYRLSMMKEVEMFGHTTSFAYREAMALSPKKVREALAAVLASGNHIEFVVKAGTF